MNIIALLNRVKWIAFLYSVVSCGSLFSDSAYKTERIIYLYMWKDIIGYEGLYQVSSDGKVKSLKWWKERILKIWRNNKYYSMVKFCKDWIKNWYKIHRIVAIHFIPNPLNLPYACHKDETLDENGLLYNWEDNLYWGTAKDNAVDCHKKWRANNNCQLNHPLKWKFWKDHYNSKKVLQYSKKMEFIKQWDSTMDIQRELWVHNAHISGCCLWKYKTAWWFIWRYKPI